MQFDGEGLDSDNFCSFYEKKVCDGMEKENLFKWKHYQPDVILLTVKWYLRYNFNGNDGGTSFIYCSNNYHALGSSV
jgi:hypothetical protein